MLSFLSVPAKEDKYLCNEYYTYIAQLVLTVVFC